MDQRLAGKLAIVTGAGQGIGRAVALRLAAEGADIVIAEINAQSAEQAAAEVRGSGRRALAHIIDLTSVAAIQRMVERVVEEFGKIDILVNNAGLMQTKPLMDVTEAEWDRVVDVNEKATFFCIQAVAAQMIRRVPEDVKAAGRSRVCYGKIVNFSSISGRRGRPLAPAYAASKAAVISLTQSAALAFAPYNINVNAVAPSVVATPMWEQIDRDRGAIFGTKPGEAMRNFVENIPLKRAGAPEDVAGAVAFLCSPDSDYITGQCLNVDGGYEMN
jgi:NAD(P)-dependent dehydrogenase (short-subunit alcohol dehydrogenase family)